MEVTEILNELAFYEGVFPRRALKAAVANREAIIPELLSVLGDTIENIDELLDEPDYMLHLYAMYLLAQFREERAYPLFIELGSIPGEAVLDVTGDVITEDFHRMLAAVCGGDIEPIKALAENPTVNEYVRSAALDSLVVLVARGIKSREEILAYFQSLFREKLPRDGEFIWSALVSSSTDLYPDVLYDDIKQAFADDLVDPMFIDLKLVDLYMEPGKKHVLEKLETDPQNRFIEDTIAEMENWAAFRQYDPVKPGLTQKRSGQVVREGRKIGRNEPCPCGSGLKYKRCCGKKRG